MGKLYPLKFKKVFKEKIWGGRSFSEKLNMTLPTEKLYGESWKVSSHKNGMSIVENGRFEGKTLEELFLEYKGGFVGENIYSKYGEKFPLLMSIIIARISPSWSIPQCLKKSLSSTANIPLIR